MKGGKRVTRTFYLPAELDDMLQSFARSANRSVSDVVREALEVYFETQSQTIETEKTSEAKREKKHRSKQPSARLRADSLLEHEGFVHEASLRNIHNMEAFFNSLRARGAVIIETQAGRVAVHPGFWARFAEAVEDTQGNLNELAKREDGEKMVKLFRLLSEANAILKDADGRVHLPAV